MVLHFNFLKFLTAFRVELFVMPFSIHPIKTMLGFKNVSSETISRNDYTLLNFEKTEYLIKNVT